MRATRSKTHTGLIVGVVIGGVAALIIAALLSWLMVKRRRRNNKQTADPQVTAPATETTAAQINEAVERRFREEKASRAVQITAEPIDTISIDSTEHGRATLVGSGAVGEVQVTTQNQQPAEFVLGAVTRNSREDAARHGVRPAP